METQLERKGYLVAIEWDGNKPPTTWYTTLARYGLNAGRGNKDVSPLARRAVGGNGVAFQEGALLVQSDSLARRLASEAYSKGAKSVMIGTLDMEVFRMTEQDLDTLTKITAATSRRGPKPKEDEGRYVVMCFEEGQTYVVDRREKPICCPNCGGLRIQWWRGEGRRVAPFDMQTMDVLKYWLATRFDEHGRFEVPTTHADAALPDVPDMDLISAAVKQEITQVTNFCHKYAEVIDGNGLEIIHAMDMAYCLQELPMDVRQGMRVKALQDYYAGASNPADYPFKVSNLSIDLVDVAGMDPRFIRKM